MYRCTTKFLKTEKLTIFLFILSLVFCHSSYGQQSQQVSELLENLASAEQDTAKVNILFELSAKLYLNDTDEAIKYVYEGIELATELDYKEGLANQYRMLGIIQYKRDKHDSSLYYQNEAIKIFEQIGKVRDVATTYNNIAIIYATQDNYRSALELFLKSAEIFEAVNDRGKSAMIQYNVAQFYVRLKEYQKAVKWNNKAIEYYSEVDNTIGLCDCYALKGDVNLETSKYLLAAESLDKAIRYCQLAEDRYQLAQAYILSGQLMLQTDSLTNAKEYFFDALKIAQDLNTPTSEIDANIGLANVYLEQRQLALVEKHVALAENKSIEINRHKTLVASLDIRIRSAKLNGDHQSALAYLETKNIYQDSIFNEEKSKQLAELESSFERKKKDQAIALLTKENEIKTLTSKNLSRLNNVFIIGGGVLLVIMALLAYSYRLKQKALSIIFNQKKTIEVSNNEKDVLLSEKDILIKERDLLIAEIHHRVKNNLQIVTSMLSTQKRSLKNEKLISILNDVENRVRSMSLLHQNLFRTDNVVAVNSRMYFDLILDNLHESFSEHTENIQLKKHLEEHQISTQMAIPLGLIINEVITNSWKYAFIFKRQGEIFINFKACENDNFVLEIGDNGRGFSKDFDLCNSPSLGLQLVNGLIHQIDGQLEFKSDEEGTVFRISIPALIQNSDDLETVRSDTGKAELMG